MNNANENPKPEVNSLAKIRTCFGSYPTSFEMWDSYKRKFPKLGKGIYCQFEKPPCSIKAKDLIVILDRESTRNNFFVYYLKHMKYFIIPWYFWTEIKA